LGNLIGIGIIAIASLVAIQSTLTGCNITSTSALPDNSTSTSLKHLQKDQVTSFVITPQYDDALPFSQGLAAVKIGDKYGYIDKAGKTVVKPQFEEANIFADGLALVKISEGYSYIDTTGNMVIKVEFADAQNFSEGLAAVGRPAGIQNDWGYIDKRGNVVIKLELSYASNFSEGLAAAADWAKGDLENEGGFAGRLWLYRQNREDSNRTKV
jgi:hypothetical protein